MGKNVSVQYKGKHKDGHIIDIASTAKVLPDRDGKPYLIVVTSRDITERLAYEQKLQESEEKFRSLIEYSEDIYELLDSQGNILYISDSFERIFGLKIKDYLGKNVFELIHSDDRERIYHAYQRVLAKPGNRETVIYRSYHPKRKWIWLEATGTNYLQNPAIEAIVVNYRDITARKIVEQRKDDFIALASHELKTPLTSTKILTQVLKKRFSGHKDAAALLAKMDNQIDKLTSLVTEMLNISRIQQGKLDLKNEKFHLKTIAQEVVEELQQTTKHRLIMDWHTKEYFFVDKERVRQVLINFITNAIKYSPEEKEIILRSQKVDGAVVVSVKDFGIGIPKDEQAHIFDRFYQARTDKGTTYPGLGLGLYITKELISRMGGKVWVDSEVGKGSVFFFSLPILKK